MSVTAEKIRAYRDEHQTSLQDAKRILEREDRLDRIEGIREKMLNIPPDRRDEIRGRAVETLLDVVAEMIRS